MPNNDTRAREVATTLERLARESDVPEWLLEALRRANREAEAIVVGEERPAAPPRFLYPH